MRNTNEQQHNCNTIKTKTFFLVVVELHVVYDNGTNHIVLMTRKINSALA